MKSEAGRRAPMCMPALGSSRPGDQESQSRFRIGSKDKHDDVIADPPITVNYSNHSNPRNFYFILTNHTRDGVDGYRL